MYIKYVDKKFHKSSREIIDAAEKIIEEYEDQGFQLTLRQLYYQFVARDIIANKLSEYKRLGSVINDARLAGEISWSSIEDRTRNLRGFNHYESVADYLHQMADRYHRNLREGQTTYIEVWIEKDALTGVIESVCHYNDVDYFACRGYVSQSEQHEAARRIRNKLYEEDCERAVILHLGDHDPSGIDMTRDIEDRMKLFLSKNGEDHLFSIQRLALNMDQVEHYTPPENPAKTTDSRFEAYMNQFGTSSWELDALSPKVIQNIVRNAIADHTDSALFDFKRSIQIDERESIVKIADNFDNTEE